MLGNSELGNFFGKKSSTGGVVDKDLIVTMKTVASHDRNRTSEKDDAREDTKA